MKKRKTPDLEKYLEGKKRRFVNYTQGAKIYYHSATARCLDHLQSPPVMRCVSFCCCFPSSATFSLPKVYLFSENSATF